MGLKPAADVERYGLDARFERVAAVLACTSATFYRRIGHAIDPERFADESARFAVRAAQASAKDSGSDRGPASSVVVMQRLASWRADGRVTVEQTQAVNAMFDDVEDAGVPSEESIVSELRPVIRQIIEKEAVKSAVTTFQTRGGDWSRVQGLLQKAANVGLCDESRGTFLVGEQAFAEIAQMASLDFLPTGILELDGIFNGGLRRGFAGMVVGATGSGKTMFMTQSASHSSLRLGLFAAYASLELPKAEILSRVIADATNTPTRSVQNGGMDRARQLLAPQFARGGNLVVKDFTPEVTSLEDVFAWVMEVEQEVGREVDVLYVDSLDCVTVSGIKERDSSYKVQKIAAERLHGWADRNKRFSWTASQAQRGNQRRKRIDVDDIAESIGKAQKIDALLTLNMSEQNDEVVFFLAKNRAGPSRVSTGALATELAYGRIAATVLTSEQVRKLTDDPAF